MFQEKKSVYLVRLALSVLAGSAMLSANAQEVTQEKIQRVEITGSNIKRIDKEGMSPVTVMTKEQIARSGATSVLDVMRNLTSAGGNGGEFTGSGSFRNGATTVSLRGLPTLVLLNGNRLPLSGSDEYSGTTSVDLNGIPLAAIERIDVLKDGASAIYGTDAIGGVINFITRKDYQGLDADASFGTTTTGGGDIAKASVTGGFGDRGANNYNVTYAFNYEKDKAIRGVDRDWANKIDFRDQPGGLVWANFYGPKGTMPGTLSTGGAQRMPDPECEKSRQIPYQDVPYVGAAANRVGCQSTAAEAINLVNPFTRYSAFVTANWDISPTLNVFGSAFFNHFDKRTLNTAAWIQSADRSNVLLVPANNPFNTYKVPVRVRRQFQVEEGGSGTEVDFASLIAGATGQIGDAEWKLTLGHGTEKGLTRIYGSFMHDKLQQYVIDGKYNPFGANHNSPQIISELTADHFTKTKSTSDFIKFNVSGEFGQLPGGKIGVAAGFEHKKEDLSYDPSQAWQDGAIGIYSVLRGIHGSEKLSAVYGELSFPFLKNLEGQLAVRHDKYELAGGTTNPKVGLRYAATENLMFRTNYSTGFRSPSLSQRFNEGRGGFGAAEDPKRCVPGDVYFDFECRATPLVLISGTKDLKPETSKQFNFGFVFEPIKDLSLGSTYWKIDWKNKIESLDGSTILSGEDGPYKKNVKRRAVTTEDQTAYNALTPAQRASIGPLVGRIEEIAIGLVNRSSVKTSGLDFDAAYTFRTANYGKFKVAAEATYTLNYDSTLEEGDSNINCPNNTACDAGEYNNPRILAKLGTTWDMGSWTATGTANFTSGYRVSRAPTQNANRYYDLYESGASIASNTTFDTSVAYAGFANTVLRFGVNNLFNRIPSFDPSSSLGYNSDYGNPRGRYIYGSISYKFK